MKSHYYSQHAAAFRAELAAALPREVVRDLHRKQPYRHAVVAVRQFALLALTTWGLVSVSYPVVWVPLAIVQGLTVFNFTVLLHEVVHHAVFETRRPRLERVLGFLYAIPSGMSASQFTRWHLDHHYFAGVSFYRLPALQRVLTPHSHRKGSVWRTYGALLRGWLIQNQAAHTNWVSPHR